MESCEEAELCVSVMLHDTDKHDEGSADHYSDVFGGPDGDGEIMVS